MQHQQPTSCVLNRSDHNHNKWGDHNSTLHEQNRVYDHCRANHTVSDADDGFLG